MLRNSGLRQWQPIYNIAAYATVALDKVLHNGNPRRMPERLEHRGCLVLLRGKLLCFGLSHENLIYRKSTIKKHPNFKRPLRNC
jgi:hypothetical protein